MSGACLSSLSVSSSTTRSTVAVNVDGSNAASKPLLLSSQRRRTVGSHHGQRARCRRRWWKIDGRWLAGCFMIHILSVGYETVSFIIEMAVQ